MEEKALASPLLTVSSQSSGYAHLFVDFGLLDHVGSAQY